MALQVGKLSKLYGQKWVLRDVDLDVRSGSVFGIFGSTGAGKTTLLRCIAGDESPNGGTIFLDGRDITALPAKARRVYLNSEITGSGIGLLFARKTKAGSAGEARVAELGRALESDANLLLLDEPLLGLGLKERDEAIKRIQSFAADGNTVIVTSTAFQDIAAMSDNAAVIVNGEIVQIGTPHELYDQPTSVGAVVGRNNLFAARRLSSSDAGLPEFISIDGGHRLFTQATEKSRLGALNQNVTLAIRPEQVSISFGASFPEDNLLKATVLDIKFHGETTLIELDAGGLRLEARVFRVVGLEPGEECMVSLPPDRLQVLKD